MIEVVWIVGIILFLYRIYLAERYKPTRTAPKKCSVIIPTYNEKKEAVVKTIQSCLKAGADQIIVVDDGSRLPFKGDFPKTKILYQSNAGKKTAQLNALHYCTNPIIITVDSDTYIPKHSIAHLVSAFKPGVGAVCGNIKISNKVGLNRIVQFLYWGSFNIWRKGQSVFQTVPCCSGAFSAYRRKIFEEVKERYSLQEFAGKEIQIGDDRYLTSLILLAGYGVEYNSEAIAYTEAPEKIKKFIKQQIRWSKSYWISLFTYQKKLYKLNWYTIDAMSKVLSRGVMVIVLWDIIFNPHLLKIMYIIVIGFIFSVYGIYKTKNIKFMLFSFWGIIALLVMTPVSVYSLITCRNSKWGTR